MSLSCNCNENIIHIRVAKIVLFEVVKANAITFARVLRKDRAATICKQKANGRDRVVDPMSA